MSEFNVKTGWPEGSGRHINDKGNSTTEEKPKEKTMSFDRPFNLSTKQTEEEGDRDKEFSREHLLRRLKETELHHWVKGRKIGPIHVDVTKEMDFGTGQVESVLRHTIGPRLGLDMADAEDDADAIYHLDALKKQGRIIKR